MTLFLPDFIERFWSHVDKRGPNECWNWTGDKFTAGYGRIYQRIAHKEWKQWGAHRVSFALEKGYIARFDTCHTCDNPSCVNPRHLFDGTRTDNMQDCERKGRTRNKPFGSGDENHFRKHPELVRRGENHVHAVLTDALVRKVYARRMKGKTAKQIAESMNLNFKTVLSVVQGFAWKHLLGVNGNPTLAQLRSAGPGRKRKLEATQVAAIRKKIECGVARRKICEQFKISPAMLSLIHTRKAWPNL